MVISFSIYNLLVITILSYHSALIYKIVSLSSAGILSMEINVASVTSRNQQKQSKKQEEFSEMMTEIAMDYLVNNDISTKEGLVAYYSHLSGALSLHIKQIKSSSLILVVQCRTLEILKRLWTDYRSGHLNEVAEHCLVTERIKRKFDVESLTLKTTIVEADYWACRRSFQKHLGDLISYFFLCYMLRTFALTIYAHPYCARNSCRNANATSCIELAC